VPLFAFCALLILLSGVVRGQITNISSGGSAFTGGTVSGATTFSAPVTFIGTSPGIVANTGIDCNINSAGACFIKNSFGSDQITLSNSSVMTFQSGSSNTASMDANQHFRLIKPTAPTVTANCGTSPTVTGTDQAFQLNVGTGGVATTCTITFTTAWGFKPVCTVTDETSQAITTTAVPASATVILTGTSAWTASSILDVLCFGNQ
jgi:hypothetical protein